MQTAKDIFLNAARENQAFHMCVHMEQAHLEEEQPAHVRRAYGGANETALLMSDTGITNLFTTFKSDPTAPMHNRDIKTRSESFSALENPTHLAFLRQSTRTVGLITGLEAPKCVSVTRDHMIRSKITPIMVLNGIDLQAPANDHDLKTSARALWGETCLTTTTSELREWTAEL